MDIEKFCDIDKKIFQIIIALLKLKNKENSA